MPGTESTPAPAKRTELTLLIVCRANRYRSPIAEHICRQLCTEMGLNWTVSSAGTAVRQGSALDPDVTRLLDGAGIRADPAWVSRRVTRERLDAADLVLTSDRARNPEVTAVSPRSLRSVFTLRQFARYLRGADPMTATTGPPVDGILRLVRDARARLPAPLPEDNDIPDPARRPRALLGPCYDLIAAEVTDICRTLGASGALGRATRPS